MSLYFLYIASVTYMFVKKSTIVCHKPNFTVCCCCLLCVHCTRKWRGDSKLFCRVLRPAVSYQARLEVLLYWYFRPLQEDWHSGSEGWGSQSAMLLRYIRGQTKEWRALLTYIPRYCLLSLFHFPFSLVPFPILISPLPFFIFIFPLTFSLFPSPFLFPFFTTVPFLLSFILCLRLVFFFSILK